MLKVRGIRFRVDSYFLERDSQYWRTRFIETNFPSALGSRESMPFVLDEDPDDLALFLWVFYNR